MISLSSQQRLRKALKNIESADEIVEALNEFIERFILVSGDLYSNTWQTIYELEPSNNQTTMTTFSIIGRESVSAQAGLKRTAVFYTQDGSTSSINLQQSDFTNKSSQGFDARIVAESGKIKFQVKGATNNFTRWRGSVEVEKLGD